jgi:hypothetical protein
VGILAPAPRSSSTSTANCATLPCKSSSAVPAFDSERLCREGHDQPIGRTLSIARLPIRSSHVCEYTGAWR